MRPMDHMDYEDENTYTYKMKTIDPNSWVTTYAEFLQDLIWYLKLDGNKIPETEGLTEFQRIMLWDYLVSFAGNPITVKDVGFQIPIYTFDTTSKGIEETYDILLDAVLQKFCINQNKKYKKNINYPFNNASISDMDDYLDSVAKKSKSFVSKTPEKEIIISPPPDNLEEALDFLKGLT